MSLRFLYLILLTTSSGGRVLAQVLLEYPAPFAPNGHVGELFSCQIKVLGAWQGTFRLELELQNDTGAVLSRLRSDALSSQQLPLQLNRQVYGQLNWHVQRGRKPDATTGEILQKPGMYRTVVRVLAGESEAIMVEGTQVYVERRQRVSTSGSSATEGLLDKDFSSKGQASVEFVHNTWEYEGNALPQTYAQFQMQPTLRVFGLPFFADVRFNTFQGASFQPMNQFSIGFSGDHLKSLLLEALLEKKKNRVAHLQNLSAGDRAKVMEKQLYDSLLKTPEAQKGIEFLQKRDSLESLKRRYEDSLKAIQGLGDVEMDSLTEAQRHRIDSLKLFSREYRDIEQWLERYYEIEAQAKALEGYGEMAKRHEQLQSYLNQQVLMDSLVADVDPKPYQNLKGLEEGLKAEGLGNPLMNWLMRVKRLSIGANYAKFSNLTLDRTRTDGIHFSWASDGLFLEFVHGRLLQPVISLDAAAASYRRKLTGFRVGVGKTDGNFIALNWQQSADDISSIQPRDSVFQYQVTPEMNVSVSVEGQIHLIKEAISLDSEWAMSATETDASMAYDSLLGIKKPVLYGTMLRGKSEYIGQQAGFAWLNGLRFKLDKIGLHGSLTHKRIDPGYRSHGVAFLQRNIELAEAKVKKRFWGGRFAVEGMVQYMVYGLDSTQQNSYRWGWGTTLDLRLPRLPSLRISYQPILMQWEETRYYLHAWTGQAQYARKIKRTPTQWLLSFSRQQSDITLSTNAYVFNQVLVNATQQMVGLKLQTTEGLGYLYQRSGNLPEIETIQLSGGIGFPIGKKLGFDGSVQLNYSFEREHSVGGQLGLSWQLHKTLTWMNRFEMNQYQPLLLDPLLPQTGFVDVLFRSTLRYQW